MWMSWLSALALTTGLSAASAVSVTPAAPSPAILAASPSTDDTDIAPRLRFSLRLSRPHASEAERDLLLREYRLTQAASAFWPEFDELSLRIRTAAQQVEALRSQLGRDSANAVPLAAGASVATESSGWDSWLLPAGGAALALGILFASLRARRRRAPLDAGLGPLVMGPDFELTVTGDVPPAQKSPEQTAPAGVQAEAVSPHPMAPALQPISLDPATIKLERTLNLAQVMLTYGRASSAMRILRDYLVQYPAASVRPWLKLLETYQLMGLRDEFDLTAQNLHDHFNVRTPSWDDGVREVPLRGFFEDDDDSDDSSAEAPLATGLEQLPHISARVQATWGSFECRDYLRMLLLDNRGGARSGFPVAVVTDILLLEDVLNELLSEKS